MPKYYVSILKDRCIVEANDPVGACIKVSEYKSLVTCGFEWKVSEKGFNNHDDDMWISDEIINEEAVKRKKQK